MIWNSWRYLELQVRFNLILTYSLVILILTVLIFFRALLLYQNFLT